MPARQRSARLGLGACLLVIIYFVRGIAGAVPHGCSYSFARHARAEVGRISGGGGGPVQEGCKKQGNKAQRCGGKGGESFCDDLWGGYCPSFGNDGDEASHKQVACLVLMLRDSGIRHGGFYHRSTDAVIEKGQAARCGGIGLEPCRRPCVAGKIQFLGQGVAAGDALKGLRGGGDNDAREVTETANSVEEVSEDVAAGHASAGGSVGGSVLMHDEGSSVAISLSHQDGGRTPPKAVASAQEEGSSLGDPLSPVSHSKQGGEGLGSVMDTESGDNKVVRVGRDVSTSHTEEGDRVDGIKRYRHPTKNLKRDMIRSKLEQALSKWEKPEYRYKALDAAVAIEHSMFRYFGKDDSSTRYTAQARAILFNLRDPKNVDFPRRVLTAQIQPERLTMMDSVEMASESVKRQREIYSALAWQNVMNLPGEEVHAVTDMFFCRKCQKRKCTYYQMQTRSADEPMTTFVTCLNCGNRWKES